MSLEAYQSKRNFRNSPEPQGSTQYSSSGFLYVFHKHKARRLHYDLRLELDSVLKSWAVPKGPSLNPKQKRLAIHVEDHPLEYGSFEGIIPEGQYGAGTVMVWDRGYWEPLEDPLQSYNKGVLKFRLYGQKLKGGWVLTRMHLKNDRGQENWLLIKEHDPSASETVDITLSETKSVLSGLDLDQIRSSPHDIWDSGQLANAAQSDSASGTINVSQLYGARLETMPSSITPQSAQLVNHAPDGDEWIHEIKYDGYRIICFVKNATVTLMTRNGKNWTDKFKALSSLIRKQQLPDCIFDGEAVVLAENGTTSFQALQNSFRGSNHGRLSYYIFDLIYFDNYLLTSVPLIERKKLLYHVISLHFTDNSHIRFGSHFEGNGPEVFDQACKLHLEGIVSKLSSCVYEQRRTPTWLKTKCVKRQEFVIIGFTDPSGGREGFGALHLGYYSPDGELIYCGKVGTGFSEETLKSMYPMLKRREQKSPPLKISSPVNQHQTHWIKPELVAEIEYLSITDEGFLRHPSFKGLREDKVARDVPLETSLDTMNQPSLLSVNKPPGPYLIAGVALTNPDKVLYTNPDITKQQLAHYYYSVADRILPYCVNRPLVLVRCPSGLESCFYQKHIRDSIPSSIHQISITEQDATERYCYISDIQGLISLTQLSALEIHLWGSTISRLENPDMLLFDLDPGNGVPWIHVIEAALLIRNLLGYFDLVSFVKTTGGKGLHIVSPLEPACSWSCIKEFSKKIALFLSAKFPERFAPTISKELRSGRIFIDYIRNSRGATIISPYATRARPGCPLSIPVTWDNLVKTSGADQFTINNFSCDDNNPWGNFHTVHQKISPEMLQSPVFTR